MGQIQLGRHRHRPSRCQTRSALSTQGPGSSESVQPVRHFPSAAGNGSVPDNHGQKPYRMDSFHIPQRTAANRLHGAPVGGRACIIGSGRIGTIPFLGGPLCFHGSASDRAQCENRERDAQQAQHESEESAWVKEGGLRGSFFFIRMLLF